MCAVNRGYRFRLTAVKGDIKTEGLAMVQAPCEPKNRGWENLPEYHDIFKILDNINFVNKTFFSSL